MHVLWAWLLALGLLVFGVWALGVWVLGVWVFGPWAFCCSVWASVSIVLARVFWALNFLRSVLVLDFEIFAQACGIRLMPFSFCRSDLPGASIFAMRSFGVEGGGAEKRAFLQERFWRSVFAGAFLQERFR